jgi:hypothetical protein
MADFNGDGKADLVWQNDQTRQVYVWYMGGLSGGTYLGANYLAVNGMSGWKVIAKSFASGRAVITNPTSNSVIPAGSTMHVTWTGGCAASSYQLTIDRQTASTIQQYLLGPGIQSWDVDLGSDLPQGSIQTVRLLTICGGVQQLPSAPLSTPLGTCEDLKPCAKYTIQGSGSPTSAACSPAGCNAPVWSQVNFVQATTGQPLWYCYNVMGPNDSQPVGQVNSCYNQSALTVPPFTLALPTCGQSVNGVYPSIFSYNGLSNDYNDCNTNYHSFSDGTYPNVGLPDAPYFWNGCDQNGNCRGDVSGTTRLRGSPEVRSSYIVNKTDPTSLWFRGFEFKGKFTAPPPPQTIADAAVFFSNGINFSGGMEYGFRLTYNKQYPVEFYYSANSNCNCGLGYPCTSDVQCKSIDTSNGPLVAPISQELPIPTVQLNTEYYFEAWIYLDTAKNRYMFKVDVLDTNFNSVCATTWCANPIVPWFQIPRDLASGQIYAKVTPINPAFPAVNTTDAAFATPTSPITLSVDQLLVGKNP